MRRKIAALFQISGNSVGSSCPMFHPTSKSLLRSRSRWWGARPRAWHRSQLPQMHCCWLGAHTQEMRLNTREPCGLTAGWHRDFSWEVREEKVYGINPYQSKQNLRSLSIWRDLCSYPTLLCAFLSPLWDGNRDTLQGSSWVPYSRVKPQSMDLC